MNSEQFEAHIVDAVVAGQLQDMGATEVGERTYDMNDHGDLEVTVRALIPLEVRSIVAHVVVDES